MSKMVNYEKLALTLARCNSEEAVVKELKRRKLWDKKFWRDYGDNENNFSVIGNQQNFPDSALTEKLINSVDAVLMREVMTNGIDPASSHAPQTIDKALSYFFNIPEGKLSNMASSERSKLSRNIYFVASGRKEKPNYSIIDRGEGQEPKMFPKTILSLNKSNKLKIPFVQGKFNMGGSGVLQFCGNNNLQLIISKRHPDLSEKSINSWGVTVVRREPPTEGKRNSVYTYLAPNNQILSFEASQLNLLPSRNQEFGNFLEYGTYIKLFEYKMIGLTTNILFDLYYRLSSLMPSLALPIRMSETRNYKGHTLETIMSGLNVRLKEDRESNIEENFPFSSTLKVKGQKMKLSIIAFKRNKAKNYKKQEGIIFTINGQTHGAFSKHFFTRKRVGMGSISDSLLIIVDCTSFEGRFREDLFMNSRDRLREGELKKSIEQELIQLISNHSALKELRERRRREVLKDRMSEDQPLSNIINNIMSSSPTLSKLFIAGERLSNPFNLINTGEKESYTGRKFPTFFKLKHNNDGGFVKKVPKNVRARIKFETDAVNDYFNRDNQPGINMVEENNEEISDYVLNLNNGIGTLNINVPSDSDYREVHQYKLTVTDETRSEPFIEYFSLITDAEKSSVGGGNGKRKGTSALDLPNIAEIFQEDWEINGFDRETALKIDNNGDSGYDFRVNMDNVHLNTEIKSKNPELIEATRNQYKYGIVYCKQ